MAKTPPRGDSAAGQACQVRQVPAPPDGLLRPRREQRVARWATRSRSSSPGRCRKTKRWQLVRVVAKSQAVDLAAMRAAADGRSSRPKRCRNACASRDEADERSNRRRQRDANEREVNHDSDANPLAVADNTGAKEVHVHQGAGRHRGGATAGLGDIIVCSVKSVIAGSDVKKGAVVRAVIVRCKQPTRRDDGSYVRFDSNAAGAHRQRQEPARHAHLRRRGPRTARRNFMKIVSLASRSGLMHIRVGRHRGSDRRRRPRHAGQGARASTATPARWSSKASTGCTSTCAAASGTRRAAGCPRRCRSSSPTCCWSARRAAAASRTGARLPRDGSKERYCKKCGAGDRA